MGGMDALPAQTAAMDPKSLHSQLRYKWLHERRFTWPPIRDGVVHLSATQLAMLLDGLEWTRVSPKPVKQPSVVG